MWFLIFMKGQIKLDIMYILLILVT